MSQSEVPTSDASPTTRRRSGRWLWVVAALVILVAAALALGGYWFLTGGLPRSNLAEFAAEGDLTTEPFQVREGWQIRWETTGERFAMAITGDRDFGIVIDRDEPGRGVTSPVGSGTFRLEITAEGPWSVSIVQGP